MRFAQPGKPFKTVTDTVGPDVDILGIAYDDSGATIAAGDTGNSGVSEPSTMALTGTGFGRHRPAPLARRA